MPEPVQFGAVLCEPVLPELDVPESARRPEPVSPVFDVEPVRDELVEPLSEERPMPIEEQALAPTSTAAATKGAR